MSTKKSNEVVWRGSQTIRILLANLRHLYQRRGLWLVYAVLVPVIGLWVSAGLKDQGQGLLGGFLLGSFPLGLLVATLQMETASRPFSFCLPGHRDAVRRLVFLVGLVASLAFLLVSLALIASFSFSASGVWSRMPPGQIILVLGCFFCASVAVYLLAASVTFTGLGGRSSGSGLSWMAPVAAVCILYDVSPAVQYPIVHWPVAVMAVALVVGGASWWWLGRRVWLRRNCVTPWIGFFDPWDRSQSQKYRALYAARLTKNVPPELDRFFQRIIGTRRPSGLARYAWGALYTTCVLVVPQGKGLLALVLLAVAAAAYFPPVAPLVTILIAFMMTSLVQSPLCTPLLVAGGRRERFFALVVLIFVLGVAAVLLIGGLVGLTHLLAPLVPPIRWKEHTWNLQAVRFNVLALPLVLLPVVALLQTLFYRKPVALAISIMLVLTPVMVLSMPLSLHQALTPALAVAGTGLSWGVCVSILYRIAMHSDLVRQ